MARSRAKSASKVMPTKRNGSDKSHTNGHSTSASTASGQHRTDKRNHPTRTRRVFIAVHRCHSVGTHESVQLFEALPAGTSLAAPKMETRLLVNNDRFANSGLVQADSGSDEGSKCAWVESCAFREVDRTPSVAFQA